MQAKDFRIQGFLSKDFRIQGIDKNLENPFGLGETSSLMLCLHASAFERARSQSIQTYHQSLRDSPRPKGKPEKPLS